MYMIAEVSQYVAVASFAEAWIEIGILFPSLSKTKSPPSRRRGLKFDYIITQIKQMSSRLLRGGVD